MIATVGIAILGFVALSFFGLAVLMVLPAGRRGALLPATPLFGAAFLVVFLHLSGLLLPVRVGVWWAIAAALALIVVGFLRHRSWSFGGWRAFAWWAAAVGIGTIGALMSWLPSFRAHTALVVQPTLSNDAFYYVSVSRWLNDNPITQLPSIGTNPLTGLDSPAFGPAFDSLNTGLRVGQELVQAALSSLTGLQPVEAFSPWLGLWVLLLPGAAWVFGAAFGLRPITRLALGGLLATSLSLAFQVFNQNADSILGIAFLPLVIGLVVATLSPSPRPDQDAPQQPQPNLGVPLWLAAGALSALVGTYTEFVPFLGMTLVSVVLIRPLRDWRRTLTRAIALVGVAVLMAPLVWWRAVKSLLFVGGVTSNGGGDVVKLDELGRLFLGPYLAVVEGTDVTTYGTATVVAVWILIALLGTGALLAVFWRYSRGYAVGAVIVSAVIVFVIANKGNLYISGRAVDMVTPLLIMAAVLGWSALIELVRRSAPRVPRTLVSVVALGLVVLMMGTGARVATRHIDATVTSIRAVTDDYNEAADWIDSVGGESGEHVTVAVATLFEQLWLSDQLADRPDVSYVNLRGDLGYRADLTMESFWAGEADRFVLVGPGAVVDDDAAAVLEKNSTFTLLDMTQPATVVVPVVDDRNWTWTLDGAGHLTSSTSAELEILSGRQSLAGLVLDIGGLDGKSDVTLSQSGRGVATVQVIDGRASIPLEDVSVDGGLATVRITIDGDMDEPFILEGIRHG